MADSSGVEATAKAIVSCLFKVLATHASVDVLDHATRTVQKAHSLHSSTVDTALYDSAKYFVANVLKGRSEAGAGGEKEGCDTKNAAASGDANGTGSAAAVGEASESRAGGKGRKDNGGGAGFEPFQPLLMAVLTAGSESDSSRQDSETESQRRSRVGLAHALAERGVQDPAVLTAILDRWLQAERSRPLREEIESVRRAIIN